MRNLFEESILGPMILKNRFWRSATWLNMADEEGHLTPRLEQEYLKLARGGVSTIITGYARVLADEAPSPHMLGIYDDSFIPEYQAFTQEINDAGANIVMQICYGGSFTEYPLAGRQIMGPSAVAHPLSKVVPQEMSQHDIETMIEAFAEAVRRVQASGFDGVQIHAAHSYLLSQFLSPYFNKRNDEYGGSIENRARMLVEIVERIRARVGAEFPVFVKMHCSDDWGEQGLSEAESLVVAKRLELAGVSAIEFSGGNLDRSYARNKGPIRLRMRKLTQQSYFSEPTARLAAELQVPVISVGGHRDVTHLTTVLNESDIEYFALSRPLLAEPDLIKRWALDGSALPRCTSCSKCMDSDGTRCVLDRVGAK